MNSYRVPDRPLDPPDSYWGPCEGCGCDTCVCGIDDGDRGDWLNEQQQEKGRLGMTPVLELPPEVHRWEAIGDGKCLDCGVKREYRRVFLGSKPGGHVVRGYVYGHTDTWTTREPPCLE